MRRYLLILSILALAIISVRSQAIDTEDVAAGCQSACAPVIAVSDACEELEGDEDASDWVCVCAGQGMSTAVPECLSCVQSAPASGDDDDDGGGGLIAGLGSCGFSAAPASSAAATSTQAPANTGAGSTQTVAEPGNEVVTVNEGGTQVTSTLAGIIAGTPSSSASSGGNAAASPSTTAGPSQEDDVSPSDLEGSRLTVVTATIGSGDDAMVATLTSVVPGPVVTSNIAQEQVNNRGVRPAAPAAAAAFGFAFAFL